MAWKGQKRPGIWKKGEDPPVDFKDLLPLLLRTKTQQSDQPLYQLLKDLIEKTNQSKDQINGILQSFFGNIRITDDVDLTAILELIANINEILENATFWTQNDESISLPSSRMAVAGTGITLDYSVANQVTISSTGSGTGLVPMTTGAYPGAIMFIGQRVMMVYP